MPCPSCAAEIQPTHRYCHSCGVALQLPTRCPNCGSEIRASYRFCGKCGFSLSAGVATPTPREIPAIPVSAWLRPLWNGVDSRLDRAQSALRLTPDDDRRIPLTLEVGIVAALTLIALFLRVHNISDIPVGMQGDEAEYLLQLRRIIEEGWIGFWAKVTLGTPIGHLYFAVPFVLLGGQSVEMLRLSVALVGTAFIPAAYFLARQMFGAQIALVIAVLLTFSVWYLIQSRLAWPLIPSLFMFVLAICLLVAGMRAGRIYLCVIAGLVFGLGLYTHKIYLIYFGATWLAIMGLIIINRQIRVRSEIYLFLGISLAVGFAMLLFYATEFRIDQQISGGYGADTSLSLSAFAARLVRAWDALMYVHNQIDVGSEGAGGVPLLLSVPARILFWLGLATTLLFINKRPYQFLLLGFLIALLPVILVPGHEARRYLLGVFFLLTFMSVGLTVVLRALSLNLLNRRLSGRARQSIGIIVVVALAALFAFDNYREYDQWAREGSKWYLATELVEACRQIDLADDNLDAGYQLRMYSGRWAHDYSIVLWFLPDVRGIDGSTEFGGSGALPSDDPLTEDTIFLFLDQYLPLAEQMQAAYPHASKIAERIDDGKLVYVAYLVPPPPN